MTKAEIKKKDYDNELIARFAGKTFQMSTISDYEILPKTLVKRLDFHNNWNELIRACQKFHNIKLKGMPREEQNNWQAHELYISEAVACYDIKLAHSELVCGIKWYNNYISLKTKRK